MRLAIVSTMLGLPWTGSEELWADTAEAALARGDEVFVSLWKWPELPPRVQEIQRQGARVVFRPRPGRLPDLGRVLKRLAGNKAQPRRPRANSIYRDVFEFRPDAILLSQGWTWEFLYDNPDLEAQLRRSKIPLVIVNQSSPDGYVADEMRDAFRRLAPRCSTIAFVSQRNLTSARRQVADPLPHGVVVRNPVNLRDRSPVPWPQNEGTMNFANVGRLETIHKAQDVILEAFSDPVWRNRSWKLRFFGSGPEKGYISELIRYFGLQERAEFGGFMPDIRSIWAQHHAMVMPSRIEGTPLALVEALLCGRPAIVSDVGGNAEWVEEGVSGWVADAPTAPSVFKALERAWRVRNQWPTMGQAAHERATHLYDPQAGQTLLRLLDEAARSGRTPLAR